MRLAGAILGVAFLLGPATPSASADDARIGCESKFLLRAVAAANRAGGGVIRFDCRDTTIRMKEGLGEIGKGVILDGEDRNITLEYGGPFEGCKQSNNGIAGPPIARLVGRGSVVRGLTFQNFLESLQIQGPGNRVEGNTFLAHECSDDAVSTIALSAIDSVIRDNRIVGYRDKALQLNYGGGTIEGNEIVDCLQPIRGGYDNRKGTPFLIRNNHILTSGDRSTCAGVRFDGIYVVRFEGNRLECLRGLRVSGGTEILIRDNDIRGNARVGIRVGGDAVASISANRILDNGRDPGGQPAGGVVVWENGTADLGGGELSIGGETFRSPGGNLFRGNGEGDVRNLREGYRLPAQHNCWDGPAPPEIAAGVDRAHPGEVVEGRCVPGKPGGPADAPPPPGRAARRARLIYNLDDPAPGRRP